VDGSQNITKKQILKNDTNKYLQTNNLFNTHKKASYA
jgi:c-di-AMP phosphodiesterase-like protein